ncbi:MAG: DsbE family thiol:disulfide interchange protein [Gammaproteobacteria bacterium]|nr:DsbE family thiol:disulfide interchange protein [Gammaproteobacteria bacterium]
MKKFLIPIAGFVALGGLFVYALYLMQTGGYNPRDIPSPLIGKPLPAFTLPVLHEPTRTVTPESLHGRAYLLNVWASWCVACRQEHPVLNELAHKKTVLIVGLNYKDQRSDALDWLDNFGNPYDLSLVDATGRTGIELGVYGVPETFVIDKNGIIRYKHIGPVTPESLAQVLLPKLAALNE